MTRYFPQTNPGDLSMQPSDGKKHPASIILPVCNQVETTRACLEALIKNTPGPLFELILLDLGSTDGTGDLLRQLSGDVHIAGLGPACTVVEAFNRGARLASSPYLVFLHNDVFVQPGWLEAMIALAETDGRIAAVTPKIIGRSGLLQSAGGRIDSHGRVVDLGRGQDPLSPAYQIPANVDFTPGACALVRKEAFESAGGFDPQFSPAYYEDADLGLTLQRLGLALVYCPSAWVIHFEGQTTRAVFQDVPGILALQAAKIRKKWGPELDRRPAPPHAPDGATPGRTPVSPPRTLTSLIVLSHNQLDYTFLYLDSILAHTGLPYELILVDNASSPAVVTELEKQSARFAAAPACKNFLLLRSGHNLGFAGGNNLGLARAAGSQMVLMNNDLVVTPDWLERMLAAAVLFPRAGLLGPMSNYTSGPQLVRDPEYNPVTLHGLDEFARQFSRTRFGQTSVCRRLVGFCLLIRRGVLEKIGGLDPRFGLGNFEDDDYCLRAHQAGFEARLVQDCFIHHFGSRTFLGSQINYAQSLRDNWEVFKAKWTIPPGTAYGAAYPWEAIVARGFSAETVCPLDSQSQHMSLL